MAKKTELKDLPREVVRKLARPRTGFEKHLGPLLTIYTKHKDELNIPQIKPDKLRAAAGRSSKLDKPIRDAEKKLEILKENKLKDGAVAWAGFLTVYTKARAVARTNDAVAAALEPIVEFMKTGPRTPKTPPPPK